MLPWSWATERLVANRNFWVGTTRPDGSPHAAPVWAVWLDDGLWFGTSPQSRKGRNLARDPRVVVHVESGDEVVVLEGSVEVTALPDRAADAYGAKYDHRPRPGDPWFRLRPGIAYAWLEHEYPRTATRFAFPTG